MDLEMADNLDLSTDLGVDSLEARTVPGVNLEVHTALGVDPEAHTAPGVDPGVLIGTKVEPGVHIEVAPEAIIGRLEVKNRERNLTSCKCLLCPTVYYHYFQLITHVQWVEEMLPQKYQQVTDTQRE